MTTEACPVPEATGLRPPLPGSPWCLPDIPHCAFSGKRMEAGEVGLQHPSCGGVGLPSLWARQAQVARTHTSGEVSQGSTLDNGVSLLHLSHLRTQREERGSGKKGNRPNIHLAG